MAITQVKSMMLGKMSHMGRVNQWVVRMVDAYDIWMGIVSVDWQGSNTFKLYWCVQWVEHDIFIRRYIDMLESFTQPKPY